MQDHIQKLINERAVFMKNNKAPVSQQKAINLLEQVAQYQGTAII